MQFVRFKFDDLSTTILKFTMVKTSLYYFNMYVSYIEQVLEKFIVS